MKLFIKYTDRNKLVRYSLLLFSIWLLGFGIFYFWLDMPLLQFIGEPSREEFRLYMREITNIGLGAHYFVGTALIFLVTTFLLKKKSSLESLNKATYNKIKFYQNWSKLFFYALCFSGVGNLLAKVIFGRQRPHKDPQFLNSIWTFFSSDWDFHSFPSGHTQVMFCVATMFGLVFPRGRSFFWLLALVIGITRIGTLYHFPSDVWTGGMIGHVLTLWSLYLFDRQGFLIANLGSNVKVK